MYRKQNINFKNSGSTINAVKGKFITVFTRALSKPKALYIRLHNRLFFFGGGSDGGGLCCGVAVTVLIRKAGMTITFWFSEAVHFTYFHLPSISGGCGIIRNLPDKQYQCEHGPYVMWFSATLHVIHCFV
jgi:hypothetical protein